jgi:hypothetical protein
VGKKVKNKKKKQHFTVHVLYDLLIFYKIHLDDWVSGSFDSIDTCIDYHFYNNICIASGESIMENTKLVAATTFIHFLSAFRQNPTIVQLCQYLALMPLFYHEHKLWFGIFETKTQPKPLGGFQNTYFSILLTVVHENVAMFHAVWKFCQGRHREQKRKH